MKKLNTPIWNYTILIIFLWLILGANTLCRAQSTANIDLIFTHNIPSFKLKIPKESSIDSVESAIKIQYLENGYLDFSIDSVIYSDGRTKLYIYGGNKFKLDKIEVMPEAFGENSKKYISKRKLTPKLIELQDLQVLQSIQNQGYPYAILEKELLLNGHQATLLYQVNSGNLVKFDSIKTFPSDLISYNYISKKTGIEFGKPYSFRAIKNITRNVNQTQLFTLDSTYVTLTPYQAKIILKLRKTSQNSFSGLAGVQTNSENKTEITGNVSMALSNAFKSGEKIKLEWQKPGNESQQLETHLVFPYILNLPIGALFYGNFDKQDSSFTNTNLKLGILVPTVNYGEFSMNVKWQTSSVNNKSSAELNSTYMTLYGIGYQYSLFDNPRLPKKGYSFNSQIYTGNNNLIIQGQNDTKSIMHECIGNIQVAFQLPIGSIFIQNEWGILINDSLKLNNFYRLGGAKSMRGFNEKSIYSDAYSFSNFEYRFYLNTESFIYLLYDAGCFNEPAHIGFANIFRQALGAGLNINTAAGHLSISYAIGKYATEPFLVNKGKIHIGYVNWF